MEFPFQSVYVFPKNFRREGGLSDAPPVIEKFWGTSVTALAPLSFKQSAVLGCFRASLFCGRKVHNHFTFLFSDNIDRSKKVVYNNYSEHRKQELFKNFFRREKLWNVLRI